MSINSINPIISSELPSSVSALTSAAADSSSLPAPLYSLVESAQETRKPLDFSQVAFANTGALTSSSSSPSSSSAFSSVSQFPAFSMAETAHRINSVFLELPEDESQIPRSIYFGETSTGSLPSSRSAASLQAQSESRAEDSPPSRYSVSTEELASEGCTPVPLRRRTSSCSNLRDLFNQTSLSSPHTSLLSPVVHLSTSVLNILPTHTSAEPVEREIADLMPLFSSSVYHTQSYPFIPPVQAATSSAISASSASASSSFSFSTTASASTSQTQREVSPKLFKPITISHTPPRSASVTAAIAPTVTNTPESEQQTPTPSPSPASGINWNPPKRNRERSARPASTTPWQGQTGKKNEKKKTSASPAVGRTVSESKARTLAVDETNIEDLPYKDEKTIAKMKTWLTQKGCQVDTAGSNELRVKTPKGVLAGTISSNHTSGRRGTCNPKFVKEVFKALRYHGAL